MNTPDGLLWAGSFGADHLQAFNVNPAKTLVYIPNQEEHILRAVLQGNPDIGLNYCTTYMTGKAIQMAEKYNLDIITYDELLALKKDK